MSYLEQGISLFYLQHTHTQNFSHIHPGPAFSFSACRHTVLLRQPKWLVCYITNGETWVQILPSAMTLTWPIIVSQLTYVRGLL